MSDDSLTSREFLFAAELVDEVAVAVMVKDKAASEDWTKKAIEHVRDAKDAFFRLRSLEKHHKTVFQAERVALFASRSALHLVRYLKSAPILK